MTKKTATPKTKLTVAHRKLIIKEVVKAANAKIVDRKAIKALVIQAAETVFYRHFDTPEKVAAHKLLVESKLHGDLVGYVFPSNFLAERTDVFSERVGSSLWIKIMRSAFPDHHFTRTCTFDDSVTLSMPLPGFIDRLLRYNDESAHVNGFDEALEALCQNIMPTVHAVNAVIAVINKAQTVEALIEQTHPAKPDNLPVVVDHAATRSFLTSIAPIPVTPSNSSTEFVQMDGAAVVNAVTEGATA